MNALLLSPAMLNTLPTTEHRALAERIAAQPRPQLSDAEIDAWAQALAEDVAEANE